MAARRVLFFAFLMVSGTFAHAASQAKTQDSVNEFMRVEQLLGKARTLRCQFPKGSTLTLTDREPTRHSSPGVDVTFDSIDRQQGRARIVTKTGAGDVRILSGHTALTFVEISDSGNPLVTVVFPRFRTGTREFLAVDSEHIYVPLDGSVTAAQYYGSCVALQ